MDRISVQSMNSGKEIGERARPACGFRRLAENFVQTIFSKPQEKRRIEVMPGRQGAYRFLNGFNPRISFEVIVKKHWSLGFTNRTKSFSRSLGNVGQWNKNHFSD
jgi:hypothetical protein